MQGSEAIKAAMDLIREFGPECEPILADNPDVERLRTAAAGHVYASVALKDNWNPDQAINALVCIVEMAYVLGYRAGKESTSSPLDLE
jgi:hypothetical protein